MKKVIYATYTTAYSTAFVVWCYAAYKLVKYFECPIIAAMAAMILYFSIGLVPTLIGLIRDRYDALLSLYLWPLLALLWFPWARQHLNYCYEELHDRQRT